MAVHWADLALPGLALPRNPAVFTAGKHRSATVR